MSKLVDYMKDPNSAEQPDYSKGAFWWEKEDPETGYENPDAETQEDDDEGSEERLDGDPLPPETPYVPTGNPLKVKRTGFYTPDTQPRDTSGRFRQVLARLKVDLGDIGSDRALRKIEEIENLDYAGDYGRATKAAGDLIGIIDRLDTGALNPDAIRNVRESSRELGRVVANLPFAFGEDAEKIRFSDVPPALRDLIKDMITKVEAKIGKEDAAIATKDIKSFMSGGDFYSQSDISSQMAKLLRLLT